MGDDRPTDEELDHLQLTALLYDLQPLEVYWPTGVACRQPHGEPIDLMLSDEALRRDVAELAARVGAPAAAAGAEPGGRW